MPSLALWHQLIDDEAVRRGVLVNNTAGFWEWMQLEYYKRPQAEFSERIASQILDDLPVLVPKYLARRP